MNQLTKKLMLAAACSLASLGAFANPPALSEGVILHEVQVLSLDFQGQQRASMVAKPCDKNSKCDYILARIDEKTVWDNDGELISYKQARELKWLGALITVDKLHNALMISRMLTGDE